MDKVLGQEGRGKEPGLSSHKAEVEGGRSDARVQARRVALKPILLLEKLQT